MRNESLIPKKVLPKRSLIIIIIIIVLNDFVI